MDKAFDRVPNLLTSR